MDLTFLNLLMVSPKLNLSKEFLKCFLKKITLILPVSMVYMPLAISKDYGRKPFTIKIL
jgi:hypothetical protein